MGILKSYKVCPSRYRDVVLWQTCFAVTATEHDIAGGFEYDGAEEISPLNETATRNAAEKFLGLGYRPFVVAG